MRVAPIGLIFRDDLDRVEREAGLSALLTHSHPIGLDGARLMAIAVAIVTRDGELDVAAFYGELRRRAQSDEFRAALDTVANLRVDDYVGILGTSIEAHRSVPTALACFASHPNSFSDVISRAIGLGGDVDTLAAMAGALSGSRLGVQAIPPHLLSKLEDGPKGRDYLDALSQRLFALVDAG